VEQAAESGAEARSQTFDTAAGDRASDDIGDARAGGDCEDNGGDQEGEK
jgi:hypothetical protein